MTDLPPPAPPEPPPPPPPPPSEAAASEPTAPVESVAMEHAPKDDNEKMIAVILHALVAVGALFAGWFPLLAAVAPIVLWLVTRDESAYLDTVGKEVANFLINGVGLGLILWLVQLVLAAIPILGWVLACIVTPVYIALGVLCIILAVRAALETHAGAMHRYPFIVRFIS